MKGRPQVGLPEPKVATSPRRRRHPRLLARTAPTTSAAATARGDLGCRRQ